MCSYQPGSSTTLDTNIRYPSQLFWSSYSCVFLCLMHQIYLFPVILLGQCSKLLQPTGAAANTKFARPKDQGTSATSYSLPVRCSFQPASSTVNRNCAPLVILNLSDSWGLLLDDVTFEQLKFILISEDICKNKCIWSDDTPFLFEYTKA